MIVKISWVFLFKISCATLDDSLFLMNFYLHIAFVLMISNTVVQLFQCFGLVYVGNFFFKNNNNNGTVYLRIVTSEQKYHRKLAAILG